MVHTLYSRLLGADAQPVPRHVRLFPVPRIRSMGITPIVEVREFPLDETVYDRHASAGGNVLEVF